MFNRTRFEQEMNSLRQYDVPPPGSSAATYYMPIDLNAALKGKRVGVYVPAAAAKAKIVDLIVYFHGVIGVCGDEGEYIRRGVEYLWSTAPFDKMRSELNASGRAALLIAPRLDSRIGNVVTTAVMGDLNLDKKFDALVTKVIDRLKDDEHAVSKDVQLGNIILAAHSGGGFPMYAILKAKNDLRPKIRACWGFECLYPGHKNWLDWLKENSKFRFRHVRQECFKWDSAQALRKGAGDRFVDSLIHKEEHAHCNLIQNYWKVMIQRMPMSAGADVAY